LVEVLDENEVARLIDDGFFYILEDKTQLHRRVAGRGQTETWKTLYVDLGLTEDGKWVTIRFYFPKNEFELLVARNAFNTLTQYRRKEVERLRELYEGILF